MKVLFLTDNFPPEVNAPASRTFEHCREWVQRGDAVTVISGFPNFPTGRVFPGYRNRWRSLEYMDDIVVQRVWTYIAPNAGTVRRTLDYLSFMVTAFVCGIVSKKPDVVVGTSPQFFTCVAAWLVASIRGVPFVFEVRDLWPESIKTVGAMQESAVIRLLERVELFLYRRAACVVTVTEAFKQDLVRRGIPSSKIEVVTNGVDLTRFVPRAKDRKLEQSFDLDGAFTVGYIGTHGMAHALETLLECASQLQSLADARRVEFLFLGDGARKAELMQQADTLQLKNVRFIDTVAKDEVASYWALLDAAIIHLKRDDNFRQVIPSKLFECMGMGLPVLHGVEGESAEIVRKHDVGIVFRAEDPEQLGNAIRRIAGDPALHARLAQNARAAAPNYDRRALAARMRSILQRVAYP